MSIELFLVRSLTHLSLLAVVVVAAVSGSGASHAEELNDTERKEAVQKLRDYHALFKERKVELDVRVRKDLRPAENDGPAWYEYRIVAANGWMYTEEEIGGILGLGGGRSDASFTRKTVFDSRADRGLDVYVRDDGTMTQAARICDPVGIQRLSSWRLAQAVGWLGFWKSWGSSPRWNVDPADVLESSPTVRRVRTADGHARLVANLLLEEIVECEMRYSDLPDVRMTAVRLTAPSSEIAGEVRYRQNPDGFHQPHAFREVRRRIDRTPPEIDLVEEAIVTRFSMRSPADSEPMPVIEIPDGLRVFDECSDEKGDDEVPAPSPESK